MKKIQALLSLLCVIGFLFFSGELRTSLAAPGWGITGFDGMIREGCTGLMAAEFPAFETVQNRKSEEAVTEPETERKHPPSSAESSAGQSEKAAAGQPAPEQQAQADKNRDQGQRDIQTEGQLLMTTEGYMQAEADPGVQQPEGAGIGSNVGNLSPQEKDRNLADTEDELYLEEADEKELYAMADPQKISRPYVQITDKPDTTLALFGGGPGTRVFQVQIFGDGSGSKTVTAFCINPYKNDPLGNTTPLSKVKTLSNSHLLAIAMYYLPEDAPGYGTDSAIMNIYKEIGAVGGSNAYAFTHYILGAIYEGKPVSHYMRKEAAANAGERVLARLKKLSIPSGRLSSTQLSGKYSRGRYVSDPVSYEGQSGARAEITRVEPSGAYVEEAATGKRAKVMETGKSYLVVSDTFTETVKIGLRDKSAVGFQTYVIKSGNADQDVSYALWGSGKNLEFSASFQKRQLTVQVRKRLAGASSMSMGGAAFSLDDGKGNRYALECGPDGSSSQIQVLPGTYRITETKAPAGCLINQSIPDLVVPEDAEDGAIFTIDVSDEPAYAGIRFRKKSAQLGDIPDGDAGFEGAEFQIRNVSGYSVGLKTDPSTVWKNNEIIVLAIRSGCDGSATVPPVLQAGTYELFESKAPAGYERSSQTERFTITEQDDGKILDFSDRIIFWEEVIRGGFRFHKIDSEIASRHCILDEKKDGTAVFEAAHGSGGKARQGDAQLEGAVFELVNQSLSAVKAYGKTAEPGEVLTQLTCTDLGEWIGYESPGDALPYGTYQLREVTPPEGYNLRGNQIDQTFEIREKNTIVMLEKPFDDDVIRFDIEIQKFRDTEDPDETGDDMIPVKGVVFDICLASEPDKVVLSIETDEKGTATTNHPAYAHGRLPYGIYQVSERKSTVPSGLIPVKDFLVNGTKSGGVFDGRVYKGIYKNDRPIGEWLCLRKADRTTGKTIPLSGTVFQILDERKKPVAFRESSPVHRSVTEFTTGDDGMVTLPERLRAGTYYLHEVHAPTGYVIGQDVRFEVTSRNSWEHVITWTMENHPAMGMLLLEKTDRDSGASLRGAVYEIYAAEDIVTPDGTNRAKKGDIVDIFTTDEKGVGRSEKLFLGRYEALEREAPEGYRRDPEPVPFSILYQDEHTEVVRVSLKTSNQPTTMKLLKTEQKLDDGEWSEQDGKPLAGVTFRIARIGDFKGKKSERYVGNKLFSDGDYLTDEDGWIIADRIATGIYSVKETAARPGYLPDETESWFSVDGEGNIFESDKEGNRAEEALEKIKNASPPGDGRVEEQKKGGGQGTLKIFRRNLYTRWQFDKTDYAGKGLYGTQLKITDYDGNIVKYEDDQGNIADAEWISDGKPHLIKRLPAGKYLLQETAAPEGYTVAKAIPFEVQLTEELQRLTMTDKKLMIRKTDTLGRDIEGAGLAVYEISGEGNGQISPMPILRWTTDGQPYAAEGLVVGSRYRLVEEKVPSGFIGADPMDFMILDDGTDQTVMMIDKRVFAFKTDTRIDGLAGARLEIRDSEGTVVDFWLSDGEAHAVSGLRKGETYTLAETEAPKGYVLSQPISFTVSEDAVDDTLKLINKQLLITKTELTGGKEVEGALLEVKDKESGEVKDSWLSGNEPHPVNGLETGKTYILSERKPADGYVTAEQIEFTVQNDFTDQCHVMRDDVTKVRISKQDFTTGRELEGAELVVRDESGKEVERWISGKKPHDIEMLPIGSYTLTELRAPDGYEKAETVAFEVPDSGEITKVVMKDKADKTPPSDSVRTGDQSPLKRWMMAAGVSAMLLAVCIMRIRRENMRKRRQTEKTGQKTG